MKKIYIKLSNLDNKLLHNIPKIVFLTLIPVVIISLIIAVKSSQYSKSYFFLLLCFLVEAFGLSILMIIQRSIPLILTERINLEKYLSYFEYVYSKAYRGQRGKAKQELYLAQAQVAYYKGSPEKALHYLNQVNSSVFLPSYRKKVQLILLYYKALAQLKLNNLLEFEKNYNELKILDKKNIYITQLSVLNDIRLSKEVNQIEYAFSNTKLSKLAKSFYLAKYFENKSEKMRAKEFFSKIINENPELFYVKEAKRYLKEH